MLEVKRMEYEMEELVPVVGALAEKYTAHESTSVTYEKAEQLMEAVLYCIHELEEPGSGVLASDELKKPGTGTLISGKKMSARSAYEAGAARVREKTETALKLYNRMIPEFCSYGNACLHDTVVKGIPEFFRWYDLRFEPQNTILTLDYPVLKDLLGSSGIDRILEYLRCICLEQKFLKAFPEGYVGKILSKSGMDGQEFMDNLCEAVLTHLAEKALAGDKLTGKSLTELQTGKADDAYMQKLLSKTGAEEIKRRLNTALEALVRDYYENDRELLAYLSGAVSDIAVRLKTAAEYNKTSTAVMPSDL